MCRVTRDMPQCQLEVSPFVAPPRLPFHVTTLAAVSAAGCHVRHEVPCVCSRGAMPLRSRALVGPRQTHMR